MSRMRYIAATTNQPIRFVGLSTALANAADLADWLGIGKKVLPPLQSFPGFVPHSMRDIHLPSVCVESQLSLITSFITAHISMNLKKSLTHFNAGIESLSTPAICICTCHGLAHLCWRESRHDKQGCVHDMSDAVVRTFWTHCDVQYLCRGCSISSPVCGQCPWRPTSR